MRAGTINCESNLPGLTSTVLATLASLLFLNTAQLPQAASHHSLTTNHTLTRGKNLFSKIKLKKSITAYFKVPHATSKMPTSHIEVPTCHIKRVECRPYVMPKSPIIRQLNEVSNSKVASSSLLRLQKTASILDSRFADHPHTHNDLLAYEYSMFHYPSIHTHAKLPTNQHCITNDIHDGLYEANFLSDI